MTIIVALFILTFVVAIVESIRLGKWSPTSFRSGILIFRRDIRGTQLSDVNVSDLETQFSSGSMPPIIFHGHSEKELFFREKMMSFSLFTYTPMMHGHIASGKDGSVSVTGRLNWSAVIFLITWYVVVFGLPWGEAAETGPGDSPGEWVKNIFVIAPVLVFGAIYAVQHYRFGNIAKEIAAQ